MGTKESTVGVLLENSSCSESNESGERLMREFLFMQKHRLKQKRPMRPNERKKYLKKINLAMRGNESKKRKRRSRGDDSDEDYVPERKVRKKEEFKKRRMEMYVGKRRGSGKRDEDEEVEESEEENVQDNVQENVQENVEEEDSGEESELSYHLSSESEESSEEERRESRGGGTDPENESLEKMKRLRDIKGAVEQFEKWVNTPDGSRKANANQHRAQEVAVAEAVQAVDLLDLADCRLITQDWLKEAETLYSPNTVVSYLHSLSHFMEYLLTKHNVKYYQFTSSQLDDIRFFNDKMPRWRKSYAKDIQRRHWENMANFTANPLTAIDVERFENSKPCKEAVRLISTLMASKHPQAVDIGTFTKVRDYLICKSIIRNAQRGGALSNMICGEWLSGKPSKEDPKPATNNQPSSTLTVTSRER